MAASDTVRLDVGLAEGADPFTVLDPLGDLVVSHHQVTGLPAVAIDVVADQADTALAALASAAGVRYAERGAVVGADGEVKPSSWRVLQVPEAWTWTTGAPSVKVAVVDTGVSPTDDLGAGRLVPGYDVVDGDTDVTDADGHGTLVAGLIGAAPDNGVGTAGVCPQCAIMPVRVMAGRQGTTADVAAGIAWAADHDAQVINVSLSTATPSRLLKDAVDHAAAAGSLVVASAGNVNSTARRYPAAYDSVLAVNQSGTLKNTLRDQWADASAYTGAALGPDGKLAYLVGASGATATASGVAALAFSMKPTATPEEVWTAIRGAAPFPSTGTYAFQPRVLNAAQVVYGFGGTDTTKPKLVKPGLTENELVPANGVPAIAEATDDHGVQRIDYVIGGTVVTSARLSGSQVQIRPPAGFNGPLPVTVIAYDYAGNPDPVTVTVRADTVKPTMTLVSPKPTEAVHGHTVTATVAMPDTDIDYVYSVYQANNTVSYLSRVAGTNLWRGTVPLDPSMTLFLLAVDKAGNPTYLTHTVLADNAPPAGGVVGPAAGTKVRGTFTSTLAGVTDVSGVAKAELWANGKRVGADTAAPYALAVKTGTFSGNVALVWRVTDRWGLYRTLPARTVVADNRPPSVAVTKAPANRAKVKGIVKVYVKAADTSGIARVELIVNGKVVARDTTSAYVLSLNTRNQSKTLKIQVRAYDRLGNVATTATRVWYR
ncbi:S8 family serine peptidase [Paractinoplanes deccanensis]|uniref:S8 family serine peptidase n=1 Tax=Paractinoplanes deccanensis TaxID=113561 RepID=UPI0019448D03|nr:S8 family serine peptidase [Actinoplanes deccanensis]